MFKIRSIDSYPNVFQNEHFSKPVLKDSSGTELRLEGRWREIIFKNNHPLVLELACGKGDYAVALAKKFPGINFIGIDSKGARIYTGAKKALEEQINNVAFARMKIENISHFFTPGEVDEIWITFPDPFPRKKDAKRRLTSQKFLDSYRAISKTNALLHFKTDDLPLFQFTKEMLDENQWKMIYFSEDIYSAPLRYEELDIQTYYEKKHLADGRKINYLRYQMP